MRTLVLVDGEHYPPVTRWAIDDRARTRATTSWARCSWAGSRRSTRGALPDLGVPDDAPRAPTGWHALARARSTRSRPEVVLDLSDEPVLGYRERMELAAVALARGIAVPGRRLPAGPADRTARRVDAPTLAVIGTGKRTGKTAISGEVARLAARRGLDPVVVAMGRGGPAEPQVAEAGSRGPRPARSSSCASGEHAASRLPGGRAHDRA